MLPEDKEASEVGLMIHVPSRALRTTHLKYLGGHIDRCVRLRYHCT